jgi:uncharacterized protein with NAD-binding domain and iron-sulfur cluster
LSIAGDLTLSAGPSDRQQPGAVENGDSKPVVRVAIIGGGCAGMAAAWELSRPRDERSRDPDYADAEYKITVYEQSWRLGGKGASGRDEYGRIREHGIHIWLGFYENAFRMMRECYAEAANAGMGPTADADNVLPYASVDQAIFPEQHIGVATKYPNDLWRIWSGLLPPTEGLPGTPLDDETNPFTLQAYLSRCLEVSKALIHSILATPAGEGSPGAPRPDGRSALDEILDLKFSSFNPLDSPTVLVERMAEMLRGAVLTTAAGVLQGVTILEMMLRQRDGAPPFSEGVLKFIEALAGEARKQLRDFVAIDPEARLKTQVLDLIMTIMIGLVQDRVLTDPRGLDVINHIDCKRWLLKHGAVAESVESAFVTGLYDLAFCYHRGDRKQPSLAAGQALRGALRMFFSYRGSIFWRMRGGMGETIFSPLYRVLRRRNVDFKFLHTLEGVTFSGGRHNVRVETLTFSVKPPATGETFNDHRPLDHFGCWPHLPPKTTDQTRRVLVDGEDFDAVVFAMGIDDFRSVCGESLQKLEGQKTLWKRMFDTTETVATQGAQVWMTKDVNELGWKRGSVLVSALEGPFETWADMTHTFAAERAWRSHEHAPTAAKSYGSAVKSVAYFCGLLPEREVQYKVKKARDRDRAGKWLHWRVRRNLKKLLVERAHVFWPAVGPRADGRHRGRALKLLATQDGQSGGTLDHQHVQASFRGSDRYTLAVPGSLQYRISPLKRLVMNMTIAGDWTECGFNEGCIEAAVMSGMLAANAISGSPDTNHIIGYHHP